MTLARVTNMAQKILSSGKYDGAIWTQGSPRIEETMYWFNLALDVTVPICGNAAQRYHGASSNDGPRNISDLVDYLYSKIWADNEGRNRAGMVLLQDQRIFAAREVTKADARPGGYLGHRRQRWNPRRVQWRHGRTCSALYPRHPYHTFMSEVNVNKLPNSVRGIRQGSDGIESVETPVKDAEGQILATAIPKVSIIKDSSYFEDDYEGDPAQHVDIAALIAYKLKNMPLAGFVLEGMSPYGKAASASRTRALADAAYAGFPVVNVGRGNTEGFALPGAAFVGGSNLTSTKARLLLMLCIMKFGMLPPARDPKNPTKEERAAVERKLADYQAVFDTH